MPGVCWRDYEGEIIAANKEPKYIITVEVSSRRIAGDLLNTSLDSLLHWHGGKLGGAGISAQAALRVLDAVRKSLVGISCGHESVLSESADSSTEELFQDAETERLCSLKADS